MYCSAAFTLLKSKIALQLERTGAMDVSAEEPQGETKVIANTEAVEAAQAPQTEPKGKKKARAGARSAHVAPKKPKSGKNAKSRNKTPTGAKKAKGGKRARQNTKTAIVLDLLKRPGGATARELMEATGWQPHSVRGFLSGTIRKKMGLVLVSTKAEDGDRTYSVRA